MDDLTRRVDSPSQKRAREYAAAKRLVGLADLLIGLVVPVAVIGSGGSVWLRRTIQSEVGNPLLTVGLFFAILFVGYAILSLPMSVFGSWRLSRQVGLSTQSLVQWFGDWLKGLGLGLVFGLAIVEVLYFLLNSLPVTWWLVAGVLYFGLVVVMANLAPVLLLPIFYRLTALTPSPLTERLETLASRVGARVRGVYRMDLSSKTTAANAALMGLGNTRRIVIGDTLLDNYTDDEIEVIFAHELGHHVHRDIVKLIATQAIVTFGALYLCAQILVPATGALGFDGIADVADLPLILLIVGVVGTLTGPFANALSRHLEVEADAFALRTTNKSSAFKSAMVRLANQNLAEVDPPSWVEVLLYDHPSIKRRLEAADCYDVRLANSQ